MAKKELITQERLKAVMSYDPETGVLAWRVNKAWVKAGSKAGCPRIGTGHMEVRIDGQKYYVHRLAWLYMTGSWPKHEVDHRDNNPTNNRWNNLREADRFDQMRNMRRHRDNESGYKGVSFNSAVRLYQARICVNRRHIYLGWFKKPEDAHRAYVEAATQYFGKFARAG